MTRAAPVSEPAGRAIARLLTPARTLSRRLADGPGIVWRAQHRIGPLCVGVAVGWKSALEREAEERHA